MKKATVKNAIIGFIIGIINGMLGAGGGIVAVMGLKKSGMETKAAHANAVAVILPITVISTLLYAVNGNLDLKAALPFIPAGMVGAVCAALLMKKISPALLKVIFGGFMIWAGIRMLLK